ncbi:UDP-N-acetylglucosamine 2-epimerase [Desulfoplanes sp. PS50]
MKRKICIFTGTRAEYGLLKPLMDSIRQDSDLQLQILATGMHLSPEFGTTRTLIEQDGFVIDEQVEMLLSSDSPVGTSKSMGLGLIGYSEALQRLHPDIVVILGDRFESITMACACMNHRIPVAHLHGGETTQGAVDEAFRHSITKMSHLHFTSTQEYRKRVIQLGEHPDRVFNVGAIGIENIKNLPLLPKTELDKSIDFDLGEKYFLVTFHPVTLETSTAEEQFKNLLSALDQVLCDAPEVRIIFTKANADTDGRIINLHIDKYVAAHSSPTIAFTSMGQLRYLSAMQYATAVVGNSSSGIVEAPSFKVPTVNIGDRQKGRVRAGSVIDCEPNRLSVYEAIQKACSDTFRESLSDMNNPYEKKGTVKQIMHVLKTTDLSSIIKKEFYDIG